MRNVFGRPRRADAGDAGRLRALAANRSRRRHALSTAPAVSSAATPFERAARDFFNITPFRRSGGLSRRSTPLRRRRLRRRLCADRARIDVSHRARWRSGPASSSISASRTMPIGRGRCRPQNLAASSNFAPGIVSTANAAAIARSSRARRRRRSGWSRPRASRRRPSGRLRIAGALLFGVLTSLLRMAFGGHYLSDVMLAALVMLMIVQAARMLILPRRRAAIAGLRGAELSL